MRYSIIVMEKNGEQEILEASAVAAQDLQALLSTRDVETLKEQQLLILGRLQDSNAVLSHYNDFSERSFLAVANDFPRNTKLLKTIKADLDYIFRHLRSLKDRLSSHCPDAFKEDSTGEIEEGCPNP
ncbi:hypothetical protein O6H91_Y488800 [Diphasiastrum complanatum]|nr:hypothetical protein O6H91_Y239000 [Diphasiastrum complanatum]KAJ7298673.1 hypothetical protein O6H91_Y488800 [Diphasiastrum complanatum]